jgi:hypothetical protein
LNFDLPDAVAEERDVAEFGVSVPTAEMTPKTAAHTTAGIQAICQKIISGLIRAGNEALKPKIILTTAPLPGGSSRSLLVGENTTSEPVFGPFLPMPSTSVPMIPESSLNSGPSEHVKKAKLSAEVSPVALTASPSSSPTATSAAELLPGKRVRCPACGIGKHADTSDCNFYIFSQDQKALPRNHPMKVHRIGSEQEMDALRRAFKDKAAQTTSV